MCLLGTRLGILSFREAGNEAEAWSGMKDSTSLRVLLSTLVREIGAEHLLKGVACPEYDKGEGIQMG